MPAYTNAKTRVPQLFKEMAAEQAAARETFAMSAIPFAAAVAHVKRLRELRRACEQALRDGLRP